MGKHMKYSKDGLHLTEGFESCRYTSYKDSKGVWTIGWGHTKGVRSGMHCDDAMALGWLLMDVATAEQAVNLFVEVDISQEEFDALVDFVFNLGSGNFLRSTLLVKLNAGDFLGAADEFLRWDLCGGKELAGLLRRREAEKELFLKGVKK
jgi:lysozyme